MIPEGTSEPGGSSRSPNTSDTDGRSSHLQNNRKTTVQAAGHPVFLDRDGCFFAQQGQSSLCTGEVTLSQVDVPLRYGCMGVTYLRYRCVGAQV